MDKIKIGIPRSLYYYYYGKLWLEMFKELGFEIILSPKTNKQIMNLGNKYAYDEMCLSLKNYIGHVAYLDGKCDYIIIPRIDNFGQNDQTCTNFLATFDIINNLFKTKIINYNIALTNKETELLGLQKIGEEFGISKKVITKIYYKIKARIGIEQNRMILDNFNNLRSEKIKVLVVGHPYNIYDEYIGKPILDLIKKLDVEIIYSDKFNKKMANKNSKKISQTLYFKYSKEIIGCIPSLADKVDGVIFLTTFPCGLDSLVNELAIRKIKIPTLNLIIDDIDSLTGFETRIESFIDVVKERSKNEIKEKN